MFSSKYKVESEQCKDETMHVICYTVGFVHCNTDGEFYLYFEKIKIKVNEQ